MIGGSPTGARQMIVSFWPSDEIQGVSKHIRRMMSITCSDVSSNGSAVRTYPSADASFAAGVHSQRVDDDAMSQS